MTEIRKRIYISVAKYNDHMQDELVFAKAGVQSISNAMKEITIIAEEAREYLVKQTRDYANINQNECLCLLEQILHFQRKAISQLSVELYKA